ncbi:MAG: DUF2391 family protein [Cytophagales bacterium]|nr:DUF2391 family protein [Cytophagales bacterium]
MEEKIEIKPSTDKRIGGYLHRVTPVANKSGEILNYVLRPLMVEFKLRDIFQVSVGSALLAIPVSFTEEAWQLAEQLPDANIIGITLFSLILTSIFIYFNFYRIAFKGHQFEFVKRVLGTYLISMAIVAIILTLIDKCPWGADNVLAMKRIIIVAFPAAMSGTLSDSIK